MRTTCIAKNRFVITRTITGKDELLQIQIRVKLEPDLEEFEGLPNVYSKSKEFATAMNQTQEIKGFNFPLCTPEDDRERLMEGFRAWMSLPAKATENWYKGSLEGDDDWNFDDLLPEPRGGVSPLRNPDGLAKEKLLTTT